MAVLVEPIRTEADYEEALVKIEELWGAKSGTPEGDKLDILVTLVDAWENVHYPMDPPDPVEAIRFRLEQDGKTQADLARVLGSRSRASEVMSGKRELTMAQVKAIRANFGISADVLVVQEGRNVARSGRVFGKLPNKEAAAAVLKQGPIGTMVKRSATTGMFVVQPVRGERLEGSHQGGCAS